MKKPRNTDAAPLVRPDLGSPLGYQLRRVSVLMMADLGARLAPTGLRPTEVTVLLLIGANPGCQQGEVGEMLGIKRANMVPLIARLVKKGLVDARPRRRALACAVPDANGSCQRQQRSTSCWTRHEAAIPVQAGKEGSSPACLPAWRRCAADR